MQQEEKEMMQMIHNLPVKNQTIRAVAYIRVSSVTQIEGHSLDAQERFFHEYCDHRGWQKVRVYPEEGKSAHVDAISKRPIFQQLLKDAAMHQFDVVVVHTLDRWARNMRISLEAVAILEKHQVGLVSISEQLDWSTPEGRLTAHMMGSMAQFYSESLGKHVSKGLSQRAFEGKHTGGIPFGYESCWVSGEKGEKTCRCHPEHKAGIHIQGTEGQAVTHIFQAYASGTTTLGQLAVWLNDQGFRTRNMHKLPDAAGNLTAGPKLFTTASVRGILHNPFYTGKVSYQGEWSPGVHDPLVTEEIFNLVQATLKKNCGRSESLTAKPEREYLLKGIIRCAYCGLPMWAQTYHSGVAYYREHKYSRSQCNCKAAGSTIPCHVPDDQIGKLIEAIELGSKWLEEVLALISLKDEVERIKKSRQLSIEKLRRLAKTYNDMLIPDDEYNSKKRLLNLELESLIIPEVNAAEEAGNIIVNLPQLWAEANDSEKRKLLLSVLDAVYVDAKQYKTIVAIKPKPPFIPIFRVAVSKKESDIRILNEPLKGSSVFLVETGEG